LSISKPNVLMAKKVFLYFLLICVVSVKTLAQPDKNTWIDSVFNSLSIDGKIGQLFLVPIPTDASEAAIGKIEHQVKSKEIGGVIFAPRGPVRQASITKRLQDISEVPLLIAENATFGVGQHRDSVTRFPETYLIGAIKNDTMAYLLGKEVARQMKILGAHVNISSMAQVAVAGSQDSISKGSFSQDDKRVAQKAVAYMKGLQDSGILATVKNFSINGATVTDVEDDLPVMEATVDSTIFFPMEELMQNGLSGILPSSSSFPITYTGDATDRRNDFDAPALAEFFTNQWAGKKYNFQGLKWVDLHEQKVSTEKDVVDEELIAFKAGNDILISTAEIGPAIRKIKRLLRKEPAYEAVLATHVRKILASKFDAGLWKKPVINTDNLTAKLNSSEAELTSKKAYEEAITVIYDNRQVIPISTLETKHFLYVSTTSKPVGEFYHYLGKYVHTTRLNLTAKTNVKTVSDSLKDKHVIVVGIFPETTSLVLQRVKSFVKENSSRHEIILCDFGNSEFLKSMPEDVTVVTAYTDTDATQRAIPQALYGGIKASGTLPFSFASSAPEGRGIETEAIDRFTYSIPEDAEMSSSKLNRIEQIVNEAITNHATPGCQILVARNGKVIYDKSFGGLTYERADSVSEDNLYDLASLTKVSATLQTVMFLYEKGLIDLNKKLSHYLPELKKTNKKDITLIEMLTHQAGLVPFIPLWNQTVKDTVFLPQYYSRVQNESYPLQVSPDLYAAPALRDSVWIWIGESKLENKPARTPYSYRYSDLGFLLLQRLAERIFNQSIDEFLAQNLYEPLGAYTTGFTPLRRFPAQRIAPTEDDKIYRKTHIAGTVHDERAAMLGGVAGHAGLFSNANDLAKLGQMLLQRGTYGGYRYYKPETVDLFTAKQFDRSRRGLGWDKPVQSDFNSPTSLKASPKTYGHTGFTGTCMWIDPEFDLIYIFLSNRVYPDRNGKLITSNIRSRIQDVIYDSIFDYCLYNQ
jgi:beta-N-acetylhexosaminidase